MGAQGARRRKVRELMATRIRPQPRHPETGRFVPAWKVRGQNVYWPDLWTSWADEPPEFIPVADRLESLWQRLVAWVRRL